MDDARPDLIALEGLPSTLCWNPPLALRGLGVLGVTTFSLLIGFGLMIPLFEDSLGDCTHGKARQDLDTLRQALTLRESRQGPCEFPFFHPLVGRYLQEIPLDPWGRDYILDPRAGTITSLGADGAPGGDSEEAADIVVRYRPTP